MKTDKCLFVLDFLTCNTVMLSRGSFSVNKSNVLFKNRSKSSLFVEKRGRVRRYRSILTQFMLCILTQRTMCGILRIISNICSIV